MCCSSECALSDSADIVQLCVRIMDDQCEDEQNSQRSLNNLKNKIIKAYSNSKVTDQTYHTQCDEIINHGIFSQVTISKLLKHGISKEDIINIMKYGLLSHKFKHLNLFHILNIREQNINGDLIQKLRNAGFNDEESTEIVSNGLVYQNECCVFRLTLHNIFATKILNWQGRMVEATNSIVEFLEKIGLDEHTLKIVSEKGISTETKEIIENLGYSELKQKNCLENTELDYETSGSNLTKRSAEFCDCSMPSSTNNQENYERRNFIRKNLMAPLTWAMSETLKYQPTDPVYYIACQLLRWKHNNVDPSQMNEVIDFIKKAEVTD